jgi:hypothetical protein
MENKIKEFPVVIYGNVESFTDVLSKGRCRIFYKGENRNGTYISEEFATKLISTLPYTPVKGIYDSLNEDYTDHGEERNLGRIYGIVPENPNFTWENHLDEDGVEREYACVDVLLFTALYEEAGEIIGKAQSMELYSPSIKGDWKIINGKRLFEFTDGCFLGLQILGEDVEPCFEGASFFTLYNSLKDMVGKIESYAMTFQKKEEGGQTEMPTINFKLSDGQKHEALWMLLNPNYNEDSNWEVTYSICDIYDEYAIAYNYETGSYERVYYTKDDSSDSLEINAKKKCYIVDVTEEEKVALDTLQKLNGGTYEKADETFEKIQTLEEEKENFDTKIGELNTTISTLTTEKENVAGELSTATEKISTLEGELETLKEYKLNIENQEKEAVISKYSEQLSEEVLNQYKEKISEYTVLNLEKDLAYELVNSNPTVFTKNPQFIPKDNEPQGGIEGILSKYKK